MAVNVSLALPAWTRCRYHSSVWICFGYCIFHCKGLWENRKFSASLFLICSTEHRKDKETLFDKAFCTFQLHFLSVGYKCESDASIYGCWTRGSRRPHGEDMGKSYLLLFCQKIWQSNPNPASKWVHSQTQFQFNLVLWVNDKCITTFIPQSPF